MKSSFDTTEILGFPFAELDYERACDEIIEWAWRGEHRMVVVAPVSSVMMARWSEDLGRAFDRADMIASDGMPIVWARRLMGQPEASRLYGPDLMLRSMEACEREGVPVALLGGHPDRLNALRNTLADRYPDLRVNYAWSPPFRRLSDTELITVAEDIAASGARVAYIGIGCPKQELLMHRLVPLLPVVQIGVGAAFDFIPGFVRQAPPGLQRCGLEWAFRIMQDPGRLWKRYASTIPPFVCRIGVQIAMHHLNSWRGAPRGAA